MSSFEPPTSLKVVLHTTRGPLTIELWAKETPILSRRFVQNCVNNVYKDCTFDKIIKNYIVQLSTIPGHEALPFGNEIHQRLRFNRRGLLGCCNVNGVRNSNNDQFFITTSLECTDLQGTTTLFGKIVDNTIFNVLKIEDSEVDEDGRPLYSTVVTKCEVLVPYFDDLEVSVQEPVVKKRKVVKKKLAISFDDEDLIDNAKVKIRPAILKKDNEKVERITKETIERPIKESDEKTSEDMNGQKSEQEVKENSFKSSGDKEIMTELLKPSSDQVRINEQDKKESGKENDEEPAVLVQKGVVEKMRAKYKKRGDHSESETLSLLDSKLSKTHKWL